MKSEITNKMKKLATITATVLLLAGCNSNNTSEQTNTAADTTKQETTQVASDSTSSNASESEGQTDETKTEKSSASTNTGGVEEAESYIRKMNKMGVPCFIDKKDNSLHIELMENISGDYNELARYTLHEAISNGVKGITCCKVYFDRELVGSASLDNK